MAYITKGIGGFYYVKTADGIVECKARGIFRKRGITPVAGDNVTLSDDGTMIDEILPRKNVFIRPPIANLDILFIVTSTTQPVPSTLVLDQLAAAAIYKDVQPVLVVTKSDLAAADMLRTAYAGSGIPLVQLNYETGEGLDEVKGYIEGHLCAFCGNSGVGKSTLMGMIAKNVKTDINVIALVGERGREVLEFVQKDLGEEGMRRSVLVVATSDQPAMLRMKCPSVATAIAEYFRDQGKDVLLMMDSLTRFAMAQREIGLAVGEPPVARGYTPSIYAELPKLLERSGNFERGSITGVYTVLVEGDDTNEPIADTVRGILDGHIVLSRKLANANHFPAIDVSASISRLMVEIVSPKHRELASKLRDILSVYEKNEDLLSIGAYKAGTNPRLDYAISKIDQINAFLMQGINESFSYDESLHQLESILQ